VPSELPPATHHPYLPSQTDCDIREAISPTASTSRLVTYGLGMLDQLRPTLLLCRDGRDRSNGFEVRYFRAIAEQERSKQAQYAAEVADI